MTGSELRDEYLFMFQLMYFDTGGLDRDSLVHILREARHNLDDADYAELQDDIRAIFDVRRAA